MIESFPIGHGPDYVFDERLARAIAEMGMMAFNPHDGLRVPSVGEIVTINGSPFKILAEIGHAEFEQMQERCKPADAVIQRLPASMRFFKISGD